MIYGLHHVVLMWVSTGPSGGTSLSNEKWSLDGSCKKCLSSDGCSVVEISVSEMIVFSMIMVSRAYYIIFANMSFIIVS